MFKGTVAWFSGPKGYGFISRDDGGSDVFVYHENIVMDGYRKLEHGERVEFEVEDGPSGKPQAVKVRVLQKAVV